MLPNLRKRWAISWTKKVIDDFGPLLTSWGVAKLLLELRWQTHVSGRDPQRSVRLPLRTTPPITAWVRPESDDMATLTEIFGLKVYSEALSFVPDCRSILDLGGNIGLAALYFSAVYPECRIVSVEPLPANVLLLEKNLKQHSAEGRCMAIQGAVCSEDRAAVELFITPGYWACSSVSGDSQQRVSVRGLCIETLLKTAGLTGVDLVKMDIEGAETELFKVPGWLSRTRAVAVEFHGNSRAESGFDDALKAHGFRIASEGKHTVWAIRT